MLNGTVRDFSKWGYINFFMVFSEDFEEVIGGGEKLYFKNGTLDILSSVTGFKPYRSDEKAYARLV